MARKRPGRSQRPRVLASGLTEGEILKQSDWITSQSSVLLDLTADAESPTTRVARVRRGAVSLGQRLRMLEQAGRKPEKPTTPFRFPPVPTSLSEARMLQRVRRCALEARDMIQFTRRQPTHQRLNRIRRDAETVGQELELLAGVRLVRPVARPAQLFTPLEKRELPPNPNVIPFPTLAERLDRDLLVTFETLRYRIILTIGTQRKLFDIATRVIPLAAGFGDRPAPVIPIRPPTGTPSDVNRNRE